MVRFHVIHDISTYISENLKFPWMIYPDENNPPTFDSEMGFQEPRRIRRLPKTTWTEMENAQIPHEHRDYCIDFLMDFHYCIAQNRQVVNLWKCQNIKHDWHQCRVDDQYLQTFEYERERRLLIRENKIKMLKAQKEREMAAIGA